MKTHRESGGQEILNPELAEVLAQGSKSIRNLENEQQDDALENITGVTHSSVGIAMSQCHKQPPPTPLNESQLVKR